MLDYSPEPNDEEPIQPDASGDVFMAAKPCNVSEENTVERCDNDPADCWHVITLRNETPDKGRKVMVLESGLMHAMRVLADLKTEAAAKTNVLSLTDEDTKYLREMKIDGRERD
jgi:hypothetical protein